MARTLRNLILLLCTLVTGTAFGQSAPGEIRGVILDNKKEPVINATVQVFEGNILKGGAVTDLDGNYSVKPIDPGHYNVKVSYIGFKDNITEGVLVSPDKTTGVNIKLEASENTLKEVTIVQYKVPLIDRYAPGTTTTLTSDKIEKMPTRSTNDVAASAPGVYQQSRGGALSIGGARSSGTLYIIDGVQVQGSAGIDLTQNSIDQMEVLTSGISAKYGDASGGVVNITTKGVTQHYTGDVLVQHSIDGYNNNLVQAGISGPLYSKKMKDGSKKPLMGFSFGGEVYDDHDRNPYYDKQYTAKSDVLKNLQQNPLHDTTDASGTHTYHYSTDYITKDQLVAQRAPANDITQEARLNAKLDFQLADNLSLTAGGNFDYVKTDLYSPTRSMFAPEATPVENQYTGRGFVRFTQRFGKTTNDSGKKSIISNAFYSLQGDYQKEAANVQDPKFKSNIFNYQYVGKFNQTSTPIYLVGGTDSITGKTGTVYQTNQITGITFDRSELNPNLANYTSQYYRFLNGANPTSQGQIEGNSALMNGDLPGNPYGLYYNVGSTLNYFNKSNSNQYALNVDASFDLQLGKAKHAIGFGLYYQQRVERSYVVYSDNPQGNSLYQLMRQIVSSQVNGKLTLDKSQPIFIVNGKPYSKDDVTSGKVIPNTYDTILYNYVNNAPSTFDINLRKKLGLSSTADINIDALSPSTFSLNMFSADELLNSGNPFVSYQGYTYTGATQTGNVSFNDFFTKKDANGDYTRPIAPFSPSYVAGYILDKFQFKDILFNVGVRIERYSANTKVLDDPYSLYPEKEAGSVSGSLNLINGGKHPSNIGSNYVVYIDDNGSTSPQIVGYRNGDSWYDPTGKYIEDPKILSQYNGRDPQPYLVHPNVKITDSSFNPSESFTDYTPQVNVMPRISFTFPISDVAQFYAHYDIYVQRPTAGIGNSTPYDYLYINQNSNSIINNPNLKPQKTFDYEVGFQQKLSEQSALTLTAFYKERKNMITIVPYIDAYPTTYYTFGNKDFSTTKGMSLKYDLRRISHFSMNLSYTLQFAEGTGSSEGSTNGGSTSFVAPYGILQDFIGASLPNLRYISTLDYDSRHNVNAQLDYRYFEGEGPVANGKHFLQNAGLSFIFKTRSGEPYTRYAVPDNVSHTVVGGVGGSRLPWHYDLDLKLDKDFALSFGKKNKDKVEGVKAKKPLYLNAFIYVQNLLNTRDVLKVYGYTSKANDDGYLTSAYGQQFVPQQIDPASYTDLYRIANNDPSHYNTPRTLNIGLQFNF